MRFVGPMAQDFHAAFGLGGSDDRVIHSSNAQGVTFAAVKGLNTKLELELAQRDRELASLESRLERLESEAAQRTRESVRFGAGLGAAGVGMPALIGLIAWRRRTRGNE